MNRKLAIVLLFAASCLAATPKPPAADDVRNVHGPRADWLAVAWALNEASGTTATNVGKRSSYNGTLASDAWTSNAEGSYANDIVRGPDASGNLYYPRGTMLLYCQPGNTAARFMAALEGGLSTSDYYWQVTLNAGLDRVTFGYTKPGSGTLTSIIATTTASWDMGASDWVPIVIRWGERGITVDTVGASATDAATTGIMVRDTENVILNATTAGTSAGQRTQVFAWWDYQLNDREIRELLADPFLPFRPNLVESDLYQTMHPANPIVGRPTTTSLTWQVGTPKDDETATFTKEVDWRIAYTRADATTAADISSLGVLEMSDVDTTAWVEIRSNGAQLPTTTTVTGLSAGTLYVWQAQYREDDGTVQAFPGGIGYATTQRSSGAFNYSVTTDCHQGENYSVGTIARGLDVTGTSNNEQSMRRGFISGADHLDWCFENGCDFTIDVGDAHMGYDHVWWSSVMNDTFKTGSYFQVMGNHERALGYGLEVEFGTLGNLANAIVTHRNMTPNPLGSTYAQGGESEGCPTDPSDAGSTGLAYCSSVGWIPSASTCTGDYVTADATGDWTSNGVAQTSFDSQVLYDTNGLTWAAKLGPLEPACSNGISNYYGFTWGNASFWIIDPYLYTAVGSATTTFARSDPEWTYGPIQQAWLEAGLAADTKPWRFVFQHMLPGGLIGGATGGAATYYGRGSGAAIGTAAEQWYWDILRTYGAIGIKGHDHGWAHVNNGGADLFTAGNYSHFYRFTAESWRWTYPLDYGDPSMQGADVPQVVTNRPQWGWGHVTVTDADTATYTYRQTIVDQADIDTQSTPDTWDASHRMSGEVGDVLTVDSSGNVTLTETPNDVLVLCDEADGDFLQYGWDAVIADTNWGSANDYSMTTQDWGTNGTGNACIDVPAFVEPHANAVIATGKTEGTRVRVHYAPRDLYTTSLRRAVSNPTHVPLDGTVRGSAGLHYRGDE